MQMRAPTASAALNDVNAVWKGLMMSVVEAITAKRRSEQADPLDLVALGSRVYIDVYGETAPPAPDSLRERQRIRFYQIGYHQFSSTVVEPVLHQLAPEPNHILENGLFGDIFELYWLG